MTLKAGVLHLYLCGAPMQTMDVRERTFVAGYPIMHHISHILAHSMACLVSFETSVVLNYVVH